MHHQVQEFGDLGLERLGFDWCIGGGHLVGSKGVMMMRKKRRYSAMV
jgi:hypothetical protein